MSHSKKSGKQQMQLNRRAFLKVGGMTLALPMLESMIPSVANAAGEGDPKRYVCMYMPSGTYIKANDGAFWYPRTAGALVANNLPAVFQPFSANAGDFSILRGLQNQAKGRCGGKGGDHSTSVATYLTCEPYTSGDSSSCTVAGSSFDQAIAARNNFKAYALSIGGYDGYRPDLVNFDYGRTISYKDGRQAECLLNPHKLFDSLGLATTTNPAPGGTPTPVQESTLARNKSILDNAYQAINNLKAKVGSADKQRIEDYFTGLREIEMSLASTGGGGSGGGGGGAMCPSASRPASNLNNEDHGGDTVDYVARIKSFCDLIVLAFRCNRAQAFSLMFEYENTNRRFLNQIPSNLIYMGANMNTPGSHNEIAHWGDGGTAEEPERRNRCVSRDRFYFSHVVYLMNQLKAAQDPSGSSILDNTIIQFGNGLFDGNHNIGGSNATGLPTVIAGGRNVIHPGNFYNHSGADLRDLYYSINRALGMGLTDFRGSTKTITL